LTTTTTKRCRAKPEQFAALRADLAPYFINRDAEIDTATLALVAKCHMFLLSEPGTAKSMLVKEIVKRIGGARAFLVMLNRFADDSMIFGPSSIAGLKEGRRRREMDGYAPTADFTFFDEVWKASSALANSLLQFTHERVVFDDGVEKPVPNWTSFFASNELPQQEHGELQAIYDRTGLRVVVPTITDPGDLMRLLRLPEVDPNPTPVITLDDIRSAHAQAMTLEVTEAGHEALVAIVTKAHSLGVPVLSGRRMREAERIAKANAWLMGDDKVGPEHFDFLADYLWEKPEQRPQVCRVVYETAAPLRAEALDLSDDVAGLILLLNQAKTLDPGSTEHNAAGLDVLKKVKRAAMKALDLEGRATGRALADVAASWDHVESSYASVQVEVYGLDRRAISTARSMAQSGEWNEYAP
jgi:MoxR-like ATPase